MSTKTKQPSHRIHVAGRKRNDFLILNLVGFRECSSSIGSMMGVPEIKTHCRISHITKYVDTFLEAMSYIEIERHFSAQVYHISGLNINLNDREMVPGGADEDVITTRS